MDQTNRDYFENYDMHQFFYDVYSNARTGVLKVYFPDSVVKTVYFSEGNIVYASSNGEKDKLITILIKYKKLSQEQLDAALRQMDKNISLGRNLVNMGFITHKELIWAVKVQVISIIHSIVVLKKGSHFFNEGPLPDGVINLPLNTMKVIFDSIIMFQDREWIAEKIQQLETIYKKTLLFEEGKNRLITNPDLLEVAEAIDGKRTLADLTGMSTLEDFKVFKLLYALKFLTLVEERMPEATLPSSEDIFEIQDEPEEDLELAEEAFVQLGEETELPEEKEEPTGRLEKDQLTFPETDSLPIDREEPTEKIELSDNFAPEVEFSEPELLLDSKQNEKDVFVEFKLKEDELSYEEEAVENELQSENPLVFESDDDELEDELERTELQEGQTGFALTEQDIDSVIMDQDEESPDMEKETHRLEKVVGNGQNVFSDDATLIEAGLQESESFDDEVIDASADGSGKWLLVSLIVISIIFFAGTMYYYQFWLPQQGQTSALPSEKTQIAQAAPKEDVTTTSITSLEKFDTVAPLESGSSATVNEKVAGKPVEKNLKTGKEKIVEPEDTSKTPEKVEAKKGQLDLSASSSEKTGKVPIARATIVKTESSQGKPVKTVDRMPQTLSSESRTEVSSTPVKPEIASTSLKNSVSPATGKTDSAPAEASILVKYASYVTQAEDVFNTADGKAVTLQVEVACKYETIEQAIHLLKAPEKLYLVPFEYAGSDCVIVCFGVFNSNQEAMSALNNLPQIFYEDNNEPFVASINRLKRRFQ